LQLFFLRIETLNCLRQGILNLVFENFIWKFKK
jgi:hypothetical protein